MTSPNPKPQATGLEESPLPSRKRGAIRRASSFKKYVSISESVNDWFFSNGSLHEKFGNFATKNLMRSNAFMVDDATAKKVQTSGGVGGQSELDLKATEVHEEFCALFEVELEKFLQSKNLTMDEFQETFKLDLEEEKRTGKHFYRWMEVIEFPVFLVMMRATATMSCSGDPNPGKFGVEQLLEHIQQISNEAKQQFRKQSTLRPLLIRWCPSNFQGILDVLTATAKTIPHGLDRSTAKAMASWKIKLSTKIKDGNGVYREPQPDEEAWTRYLGMYTSKMADDSFLNFVTQVEGHIAANGAAETPAAKIRRASWECFAAYDPMHEGSVDLHQISKYLEKENMWPSEKEKKKSFAKWAAALIPGKDKDVEPIPLSMQDFSKFLVELFLPAVGNGGWSTENGSTTTTTTAGGDQSRLQQQSSSSGVIDAVDEATAQGLILKIQELTELVEDMTLN